MGYVLANPNGATAKERRAGWGGSNWIAKYRRLAIYLRDGFTCAYCGTDLREYEPANITLDHIKCRSNGGSDEPRNLITACRKCNKGRFTKAVRDYAAPGAIDRINRLRRRDLKKYEIMAKALIKGTAKNTKLENER